MIAKLIIKIYILFSLIYFFKVGLKNKPLKYILLTSVINTIITDVFKEYEVPTYLNNNIYIIIHIFLWIKIILEYIHKPKRIMIWAIWCFFTSCFLIIYPITSIYFHDYFVFTSILYIILFFVISIVKLKDEVVEFFQSKEFILILSPVMFFLGKSFMFGFKSIKFSDIDMWGITTAYDFISSIVNVIYYTLLNYYMYKSYKNG